MCAHARQHFCFLQNYSTLLVASCSDGSEAPCDPPSSCYSYMHCKSSLCLAEDAGRTFGKCQAPLCPCLEEWSVEGLYDGAPNGTQKGCLPGATVTSSWCVADTSSTCTYATDVGIDWVKCLPNMTSPTTDDGTNDSYLSDDYYEYSTYDECLSDHEPCSDGHYCDQWDECYPCDLILPEYGCDSWNSECCDTTFLDKCPSDPFGCGSDVVATSPTPQPTVPPTNKPTAWPTFEPTTLSPTMAACVDFTVNGEPWHDSGGEKYNCADHYNRKKTCESDGDKYAWEGKTGNQACCFCKELKQQSSQGGSCQDFMVDGKPWHDSGGEKYNCADHYNKKQTCNNDGDKYAWEGKTANQACCFCKSLLEPQECVPDFEWVHPTYKDKCVDYINPQGSSYKYRCDDDLVKSKCCTCQAKKCKDLTLDGAPWEDSGGFDCAWYGKKKKNCKKFGDKFENTFVANEACCICGGGEEEEAPQDLAAKYAVHKHLNDGYELFWSADPSSEILKVALLSKPGVTGWIGFGISSDGRMARADAVVGYVDEDGTPLIEDYYIKNQSPSGMENQNRQGTSNMEVSKIQDRLLISFERPYTPPGGGLTLEADKYVDVIYASGPTGVACPQPFCGHSATTRYASRVMLSASVESGYNLEEMNRSGKQEPCHGPLNLSCLIGLYCYHEGESDPFAFTAATAGVCVDADDLGAEDDETQGKQLIFSNDGGFENKKILKGGFVLLWTVNEKSGFDDTITFALVSTLPKWQGWISLGISPTGGMAGSDAVIGWSDGSNTHIGDYFLREQISDGVQQANRQAIVDMRVIKKNGQTAILFERPLTPKDSTYIIAGKTPIIYGGGPLPDGPDATVLAYHKFRDMVDVAFLSAPGLSVTDLNAAGINELCGIEYPMCKQGLNCNTFPAGQTQQGYRAQGVCLASSQQTWDAASWKPAPVIDISEYDHQLRLEKTPRQVFLYWSIVDGNKLKVAVVSRYGAHNYIAFGFSPGGGMIGSHVVVGWDGGDDRQYASGYSLEGKLPWDIFASNSQQIENLEVRRKNGQTALLFERPLVIDDVTVPDIVAGENWVVYAVGPIPREGELFGYHKVQYLSCFPARDYI